MDHPTVGSTNAIREIVVSRIRILLENARAAAALAHGASIGSLRETYLREFLASVIPQQLAITSGFVTDAVGNLSPQLDFIVYDPRRLPPIALPMDMAIIPSDSALLVAEVKSSLSTTAIDQIRRQRSAISQMKHSGTGGDPLAAQVILPHVIVSFDTTVAEETLRGWFGEIGDLLSVCVLNTFTISKVGNGELPRYSPKPDEEYFHILMFVIHVFSVLQRVAVLRASLTPRLEHYLLRWRPSEF